ncbi:hypothetical protein [Mucilaginibacter sp. AK015]|uniref:hypothetical protein n=1 Tax=Mucilaginibacter sp. AK015 TaxID=2723072 RepID=UPI001615CCE9|nr:hypothetical protein [Mucilaginibacter sp. AK015]MBB5397944.1 hypothetical protein [Mucilaginibacter sp. AK015]
MFITERQLVETLKGNFKIICDWNIKKTQTNILEEVNLGFGIADLVISKINKHKSIETSWSYFDILIYKIIETDQNVSMDLLKSITKAKESQIRKSLEMLMLECYVNHHDSIFRIKKSYKSISDKTIAIEAKLKNWARALDQAYRYKWFATQSYVVLDSNYISPAYKNIEKFIELNVGLAEINPEGLLKIHFKPTEEKPIDDKMFMLLNEQIKQTLFRQQIISPSI